jgi:hypothetical protein
VREVGWPQLYALFRLVLTVTAQDGRFKEQELNYRHLSDYELCKWRYAVCALEFLRVGFLSALSNHPVQVLLCISHYYYYVHTFLTKNPICPKKSKKIITDHNCNSLKNTKIVSYIDSSHTTTKYIIIKQYRIT